MGDHTPYGAAYRDAERNAERNKREAKAGGNDVWQQKFVGRSLETDLRALGLATLPDAVEHVMQAWRARVKMEFGETGFDMDALKQARDRLMLAIGKGAHERINQLTETTCKMCGGSGRIGVGFGRECPTCKGTGHNGPSS